MIDIQLLSAAVGLGVFFALMVWTAIDTILNPETSDFDDDLGGGGGHMELVAVIAGER